MFISYNILLQIGSLVRIGAKKNWVVLRRESHSSRSRVEVFKDEDDFSRRQPIKIVGIEQISSVNTSPEKKEIILNVGSENVILTCSSRADVDDWMRDIEALRQNGRGLGKRKSGDDGIPCELSRMLLSLMLAHAHAGFNLEIFVWEGSQLS